MKVDIDPFHIQGNYVEPMQIMMIGASIGTSKVSIPPSKEEVNQALEEEKNIVDLLKGRKGLPEIEDNEKDKEK